MTLIFNTDVHSDAHRRAELSNTFLTVLLKEARGQAWTSLRIIGVEHEQRCHNAHRGVEHEQH